LPSTYVRVSGHGGEGVGNEPGETEKKTHRKLERLRGGEEKSPRWCGKERTRAVLGKRDFLPLGEKEKKASEGTTLGNEEGRKPGDDTNIF